MTGRKRSVPKKVTEAEKAFAASVKPKKSFKRIFLPLFGGILVMLLVFGALNAQLIQAQLKYRYGQLPQQVASANADAAAGTSTDTTKSPNPERGTLLTIPSLGVEAPIVMEPSFAEWKVQVALRSGVVHYGTTAMPGENGNVVILGHSSGQAWAPGDYKFVFTMLSKLKAGELVYLDYNGTRYTYKMTDSAVVPPTDVSRIQPTTTPTLSLVTCTPVGTSTNRLIVHAELVSPLPNSDPTKTASPAKAAAVPAVPTELPASANASLWQRFLDLF